MEDEHVSDPEVPQASTSKLAYSPAMSSSDIEATQKLLDSLYSFGKGDKKLAKLLRHTDHAVESDHSEEPNYTITSWKMQDYAYKRDPCPYPTRARGLFTVGHDRIVARAYDKFFNVDEVSWTKWSNLPDLTAAPYYVTLKSNGCLILIAALSPTELLVTSKHAIGQTQQTGQVSHAQVGEVWLDRGLKKAGKSREDLAKRLWSENWTCVAELCDDSFEEHILPYAKDITGLHMHGIVVNHPTLLTLPPPQVNEVARGYGFIQTDYTVLETVEDVQKFRQSVIDNDGMWKGQHVEGFVVRAGLKPGSLEKQPHPNDLTEENWKDERRVFMWKIKFDEPYLMWREWRETTKKILTEKRKAGDDVAKRGKGKLAKMDKQSVKGKSSARTGLEEAMGRASILSKTGSRIDEVETEESTQGMEGPSNRMAELSDKLPTSIRADRIRNPETRQYAIWVEEYMETNPEAFVEYAENRGIIAVREAYLEWKATTQKEQNAERSIIESTVPDAQGKPAAFEQTLIVPVAVPGSGKTMIGVALTHLFGFAHTQSDDVKEKKAAKHFEAKVASLLRENKVVFADKNNHLKQHRQAMVDIAAKSKEKTRLIALNWPLSKHPQNEIHRICSDRIVGRGENHQSLRPVETGEHEVILMRFFTQTDAFDPALSSCDSPFDNVIEIDITCSFEHTLEYIVENLLKIDAEEGGINGIDGHRPSKEQMQEAIAKAEGYKPSIYKQMNLDGLDKSKGIRYYGIAVEVDLPSLLENFFSSPASGKLDRTLFDKLKSTDRIEKRPHVTLVHQAELNEKGEGNDEKNLAFAKMLWTRGEAAAKRWGKDAIDVKLTLGPLLCWDDRAMSIQVSDVSYSGEHVKAEDMPSDERKDSYHITVGTLNQEIRPIEGKWLLEGGMKNETESRAGSMLTSWDHVTAGSLVLDLKIAKTQKRESASL